MEQYQCQPQFVGARIHTIDPRSWMIHGLNVGGEAKEVKCFESTFATCHPGEVLRCSRSPSRNQRPRRRRLRGRQMRSANPKSGSLGRPRMASLLKSRQRDLIKKLEEITETSKMWMTATFILAFVVLSLLFVLLAKSL